MLCFPSFLLSQTFDMYYYDDAGNRILRMLVLYKQPELRTQKLADYTIKVFPNPADKFSNIESTYF